MLLSKKLTLNNSGVQERRHKIFQRGQRKKYRELAKNTEKEH